VSVVTLPRQLSARERAGIQFAFASLDPKEPNPRGRVVLDDGTVACLELNPPRITEILPWAQVAW